MAVRSDKNRGDVQKARAAKESAAAKEPAAARTSAAARKTAASKGSGKSTRASGAKERTPRRIVLAEAAGVAIALLLVAAIVAAIVIVGRKPTSTPMTSTGWVTPSDAASSATDAARTRVEATHTLDASGMGGTADFGSGQSITWTLSDSDAGPDVQYTNAMGGTVIGFSASYSLKSTATADDVRAILSSLPGGFTASIADDELTGWIVECSTSHDADNGASLTTGACSLGGHTLASTADMQLYEPAQITAFVVDDGVQRIDRFVYDFASDSAQQIDQYTLGGWPDDDLSAQIPEPGDGMRYYGLTETMNSLQFTIMAPSRATYDSYVAQCTDAGWTAQATLDAATSFADRNGYTLTVEYVESSDTVLVSLGVVSADSSSATDSSDTGSASATN